MPDPHIGRGACLVMSGDHCVYRILDRIGVWIRLFGMLNSLTTLTLCPAVCFLGLRRVAWRCSASVGCLSCHRTELFGCASIACLLCSQLLLYIL